ncbi:glycoside hydrolase family 16 protein [Cladophialophora carrionii]|uniref:Glycoside hydrolase family 16 protein n=1 Tax=Cladophialophora carrionii TaxID=86049 RepID=A0A1C1D0J4_9EURO|nr:glycoside hydrolase family 16 protein [Cladophialophora carrionii]
MPARGVSFADRTEQDTSVLRVDSTANAGRTNEEQAVRSATVPEKLAAKPTATSNDRANGNGGIGKIQGVANDQAPHDDPKPDDGNAGEHQVSCDDGDVTGRDGAWVVPGVGTFQKRAVYTFDECSLPAGLHKSNYTVQSRRVGYGNPQIPYNERFDPANVQLRNGFLTLTVPGGQQPTQADNYAIRCAEITTVDQNILYASVRTKAIFCQEPGTIHGLFFYKSDTQETDIEYLTDPSSLSNPGPGVSVPMWYTNQAVDPQNMAKTYQTGNAPTDCTTNVHEYRLDWTKDFTAFYIDGVLQKKFWVNIPSVPGTWVWNNWANGDRGWSAGPPVRDNGFRIQSITMYYNTAGNASSGSV